MGVCTAQGDEAGTILFSGSIVTVTLVDDTIPEDVEPEVVDPGENEDGVVLGEPEDQVSVEEQGEDDQAG